MMVALRCIAAAVVIAVAFPAHAETAKEAYLEGEKLFAAKSFVEAAGKFERAYDLEPRAGALARAGESWFQAGRMPEAANAFAAALRVADAAQRPLTDVERDAVEALRQKAASGLGTVRMKGADRFRIGTLPERNAGEDLFVQPGSHGLICIDSEGEHPRIAAAQADTVTEVDCTREPAVEVEPTPVPAPQPVADDASPGPSALWIAGWVSVGLAGAATAVAIPLGLMFEDRRAAYNDLPTRPQDERDEVATIGTGANIAWFAAGGFAVLGAVLLIVDVTGDDEDAVVTSCAPAACIRF